MKIFSSLRRWFSDTNPPDENQPTAEDRARNAGQYDPLFDRLEYEASLTRPRMRRVIVKSLSDSILADEILALVFGLQKPERTLITGDHWLPTALRDAGTLRLRRRIIYLYAPATDDEEDYSTEAGDIQTEIKANLLNRIVELITTNTDDGHSLVAYVRNQIEAQFREANQKYNNEHRTPDYLNKNLFDLLRMNLSVHRKRFPMPTNSARDTMKMTVFLTGRNPVHDRSAIARREKDAGQVNLALTIKAAAPSEGKTIRLNAHHFDSNDMVPQTVPALYLGDWRKDWMFTVGAAEHDEIRCNELGRDSFTLHITDLKKEMDRWNFVPRWRGQIPEWLHDALELTREGVLDKSLTAYLATPTFKPQIMLAARALPFKSETTGLRGLREFGQLFPSQTPVSAIEVRQGLLWLFLTEEGEVYCLYKNNMASPSWSRKGPLGIRDEIIAGEYTYRWRTATGEIAPAPFCGLLLIDPKDDDKVRHSRVISQGSDDEIPINKDLFRQTGSLDDLLGTKGVIKLKFHREIEIGSTNLSQNC